MVAGVSKFITGVISIVISAGVITTQNSGTLGGGWTGALTLFILTVVPLLMGVKLLSDAAKGQ